MHYNGLIPKNAGTPMAVDIKSKHVKKLRFEIADRKL